MARITKRQAYKYRENIMKAAEALTDDEAFNTPLLFAKWEIGHNYVIGDRFAYEVNDEIRLYKVLQNHTSQADWTPDIAVSLYAQIDDPAIEWPEWRRPAGAHDAYPLGAKVSHNNKHWINTGKDANEYEPGVWGWEEQP